MVKHWRYSVPSKEGEGWAVLFLDDSGIFAAASDYGNYVYSHFCCNSIRHFVANLRCDHYILDKLTGGNKTEYNSKRTVQVLKELICTNRRENYWNKAMAREEWDNISLYDLDNYCWDIDGWLKATNIDCACEYLRYDFCGQAVAFVERALPRLQEKIKQELIQEGVW